VVQVVVVQTQPHQLAVLELQDRVVLVEITAALALTLAVEAVLVQLVAMVWQVLAGLVVLAAQVRHQALLALA
jgi:hypothetical protein